MRRKLREEHCVADEGLSFCDLISDNADLYKSEMQLLSTHFK